MKPKEPKTLNFGIIYGATASIIGIIFTLMLLYSDMLYEQSIGKTLVGIFILAGVVVLAIYNFKKQNNNYLSIKQGIIVGIFVSLVAGILTIIFTYILTTFIVPDFWETSSAYNKIAIQNKYPQMTAEQINDTVEMQSKMYWITYPMILLFNLFLGFIIALITALILKRTEEIN
jgi:ABC-type Fe3+-siderophore transport system permease subunit